MGRPPEPLYDRLFKRLLIDDKGCWIWTGSARDADGYGQIWSSLADGPRHLLFTHRAMYELSRGAVPDGLDLDHLCRVPRCMNPEHLKPVTRRENVRRSHRARARLAAA